MKISINAHSSIQVDDMFFDPYKIDEKPCKVFDTESQKFLDESRVLIDGKKAKYVFLTHTHYDHLSNDDLLKIVDENTVIVGTPDAKNKLEKIVPTCRKFFVRPNEAMELDGITVSVLFAYNKRKIFHPKKNSWVGYKITKNGESFAVLGDTDFVPELNELSCDILFVPIGGTYTMNAKEAAEAANKIMPKIVVPTHYNLIVGNKKDEQKFVELLDKKIKPVILID